MYVFPNKILYSKKEFIGYFISQLNLTSDDILLVDRSKNVGQVILENKTKDILEWSFTLNTIITQIRMTNIFYGIIITNICLIMFGI